MRLDITWTDLLAAAGFCVLPGLRSRAESDARRTWSDDNDCLITLSVRFAFDLTLRALAFPRGSEVLLSALTVPDMVAIIRSHGLVPVPVDTDDEGNLCLDSLCRALSAKARMLVVPHLFGSRVPLDEVISIARRNHVYVVDDGEAVHEMARCCQQANLVNQTRVET